MTQIQQEGQLHDYYFRTVDHKGKFIGFMLEIATDLESAERNVNLYNELTGRKSTVVELVHRQNAETANNFEHVRVRNADGSPLRARRNGKTKTWKRQPGNFSIPIKIGLKGYSYIDANSKKDWFAVD